ncbi:MAG TPA: hypothetical protein VKF42_10190 [Chitinivibrionales bacterium]|nr:hypothetical protein [Chitinivibrionales bacterium]
MHKKQETPKLESPDCFILSMLRTIGTGIIIWIVFAGCAPKVMFNPDYKSTTFEDSNLNVAVEGETFIDYEGNMDNEFPPDGRNEKIRAFICSTAVYVLTKSSIFNSVNMVPIGCTSFRSDRLDWVETSEQFTADIPDNTCFDNPRSREIWLFIEQPLIKSRVNVQLVTYGIIPLAAIPHKPLLISAKFLYWDPLRKKPIAWGEASGSYENGPSVTMNHWISAANNCAIQMIKDTRFERKSGSK